jgi:hypothetical protein
MANAVRDENRITGLMGVSSVDGITPIPFNVDPVTQRLRIQLVGYIANNLDPAVIEPVKRDENRVTGMMGISETDSTPIPMTTGLSSGLRITLT